MDFPVAQVYFEPKKYKYTIPTHKFCQMTSKEILRDALEKNNLPPNKTKLYTLFIQSSECDEYAENCPCFQFSPPLKSKPIDLCNSLSFFPTTHNLCNGFQSFYISIEKNTEPSMKNKLSFSIPVASKKDQKFMYTMPIIGLEYPFTVLQIKEAISSIFKDHNPQNDVDLYDIIGRVINADEGCAVLTSYLLKGRIFATFDFTKKDLSIINDRENAINEILVSENKYANFLKSLEKNVKPFFENCPFMKREDYKNFFDCFEFLPKLHAQILEKVKKLKSRDFMSRVGSLYNPYAPMLKIYSDFNTQYKIMDKKIKELKTKPQNMKYFEEFQKQPFAEKLDISQVLSKPFQQAFRYPLLFKRLLDYTPKNHPDNQVLQKTLLKMKEATQNNDKRFSENENISKINFIQQNLTQKYNLIEADRRYIASFVVYYGSFDFLDKRLAEGRKNSQIRQRKDTKTKSFNSPNKKNNSVCEIDSENAQQCILILFTNLILIVRIQHKSKCNFTIISDIPINKIDIYPYGKQSIFYDIPENKICSCPPPNSKANKNGGNSGVKCEKIVVTFLTTEERDKFFRKYRKNALLTFAAKAQRNFSTLRSQKGSFPHQTRNNCFDVESLRPRKTYYLKDHSIAYLNDAIWIFGGINNMNEIQNKLFRVLLSDRSINYHKSDPENDITPRCKALMVGVKDYIYVFGGTKGEDIYNDLWCYSCKRFKWKQIVCRGRNQKIPPPSLGYTMNYFESQNMLIIIGGDKEFGVYLFSIGNNNWGFIPLQNGYVPRNLIGHQTVAIDEETFAIIGGQIANPDSDEVEYNNAFLVFKPISPDGISIVKTSGFQPMNISYFHAAKISKDFIIVFGTENLSKNNKNDEQICMYLLNLVTKKWSVIYQNPNKENKHFDHIDHDAFAFEPPILNLQPENENEEVDEEIYEKKICHTYFFGGIKRNGEFQTNLFKCDFNISEDEFKSALSKSGNGYSFQNDDFLTETLTKKDINEFYWLGPPIDNPLT